MSQDDINTIIDTFLSQKSDEEKLDAIGLMQKHLQKTKEEITVRIGLTLPKAGEFKAYPGRLNAIKWLKDNWGKYLRYCGANEDVLFQDQLGKLDPKLLTAVKNQLRRERNRAGTPPVKLADIVPPKEKRITQELSNLTPEELKESYKKGSILRQRRRKMLARTQQNG